MLCKLQIISASFPYSFSKNDYYAIILCASFPIYSEIHCSYVCADSLVVTILLFFFVDHYGLGHCSYKYINVFTFLQTQFFCLIHLVLLHANLYSFQDLLH